MENFYLYETSLVGEWLQRVDCWSRLSWPDTAEPAYRGCGTASVPAQVWVLDVWPHQV